MSRRIGRFVLARDFIDWLSEPDAPNLFDRLIVLKADYRPDLDSIEYLAVHKDFDVCEPGNLAPTYVAVVTNNVHRWVRQQ